ncbi:AbrB/MazE/SpoVT family DNA-binding domain-containing protein [Rossellomorea sp. LjRoot5]|uniref:AbrB/MazE/SpoVT family DNA-binding domain-containing protein n=1 Tax=Rossellomorea sp. LjRoot5 TaxID=3342331 RepID=UPI003ECDA28A
MKSTGIVRKVDELGRVVIPKELRRTLNIEEKDSMEIFVDGERVILQKFKPEMSCFITGVVSEDNIKLSRSDLYISREGATTLMKEIQGTFK